MKVTVYIMVYQDQYFTNLGKVGVKEQLLAVYNWKFNAERGNFGKRFRKVIRYIVIYNHKCYLVFLTLDGFSGTRKCHDPVPINFSFFHLCSTYRSSKTLMIPLLCHPSVHPLVFHWIFKVGICWIYEK